MSTKKSLRIEHIMIFNYQKNIHLLWISHLASSFVGQTSGTPDCPVHRNLLYYHTRIVSWLHPTAGHTVGWMMYDWWQTAPVITISWHTDPKLTPAPGLARPWRCRSRWSSPRSRCPCPAAATTSPRTRATAPPGPETPLDAWGSWLK